MWEGWGGQLAPKKPCVKGPCGLALKSDEPRALGTPLPLLFGEGRQAHGGAFLRPGLRDPARP